MNTHRPFAAQARRLCPESAEHHDRVWFCQHCRLLEMRLTPITDVIGDLLDDAGLTITIPTTRPVVGDQPVEEPVHQQATAVIADAIAEFMPEGDDGQDGLANLGNAQSIKAALREAGYAIVRVPDIPHKGPHDTNGTMLITAAEKAESARYPVGGSNVGRAVAQVLREVAAAAD